ncbi:hypothetical protein ACLOJK_040293 [Asimina triloba]
MNAVGRQMPQRSAASSAHHQRQYSDNFLDFSSNSKWLQSAGLQHLQSSNAAVIRPSIYSLSAEIDFLRPLQLLTDYTKIFRNAQRGGEELYSEPSTPPVCSRSSSQRKNGEDLVSPSELSPGILDLHSFDTELLPEVPGVYDGYHLARGKSFDDSEPWFANTKQTNRARGLADNNLLKSFAADKEKTSSAAKIKVVVRKRPLNKKEMSKKEEDVITIEPSTNSLTVHETKLKVDLTEYVEKHEFVFDAVLGEEVSNDEVYHETVEPIVPIIFQRTKATCFAYGQTGKKLCMREDGKQQVCIVGLQEFRVSNVETIRELIEKGNATRSTGTTGANEESSRSHAILQLSIKRSVDGGESKPLRLIGKLSFIDLAGSERGADTTDNDKQTRVKSLSKGNTSKKDLPSANLSLRDSTIVPLSSLLPTVSTFDGSMVDAANDTSRFGWSKAVQPESSLPSNVTFGGRAERNAASEYAGYPKEQRGRDFTHVDFSQESDLQDKPLWKIGKSEGSQISTLNDRTRKSNAQMKWKDLDDFDENSYTPEGDLNALLKEEEELVIAHRKHVEETMDVVKEEMKLLVEADQPGNQLDEYISKLNNILSQKATGILNLQTRLADFQRHLNDYNVLLEESVALLDFSLSKLASHSICRRQLESMAIYQAVDILIPLNSFALGNSSHLFEALSIYLIEDFFSDFFPARLIRI